ncbi:MAG: YggT family protein [Coriobacteriia bacterium]|nr:YggT family protein [Coriobacteriia bacterium]
MTALDLMIGLAILPLPYQARFAIRSLVHVYIFLIFIWALFSWFGTPRGFLQDVYKLLDSIVEPYVDLFRRFLPPVSGVSFAPVAAAVVLEFVVWLLV